MGSIVFTIPAFAPPDVTHAYLVAATAPITFVAFVASIALVEGFFRRDQSTGQSRNGS